MSDEGDAMAKVQKVHPDPEKARRGNLGFALIAFILAVLALVIYAGLASDARAHKAGGLMLQR